LLVEKEKLGRTKVCGGCLNANGIRILREAGLGTVLDSLDSPSLKEMQLCVGGTSAQIPIGGGLAISRAKFDQALTERATSAGATFSPETVAQSATSEIDGVIVKLKRGRDLYSCHAKVVVSAEGLHGSFLQRVTGGGALVAQNSLIGAGANLKLSQSSYRLGTVYMVVEKEGYLGIVQTAEKQLTLAAALNVSHLKRNGGVTGSVKALFNKAAFPDIHGWEKLQWKGTVSLTREAKNISDGRVFAIGDAASYIEPFSGEGMTWALYSVEALLPILKGAILKWEPDYTAQWQCRYREVIRPMQARAKVVSSLIRKPLLCKTALCIVRAFPGLATPFTSPKMGATRCG